MTEAEFGKMAAACVAEDDDFYRFIEEYPDLAIHIQMIFSDAEKSKSRKAPAKRAPVKKTTARKTTATKRKTTGARR